VGLLDLDHFKLVNDTCSHEVGDEVLRRVARVLEATAATHRPGSFAARMGGEEFLLVLVDCPADAALDVFEEVRATIARQPWEELTCGLPVTVSVGAAISPHPLPLQTAELLSRADARLYEAKHAGRDRVVGPSGTVTAATTG
jgi:two-component system cell cycle response regulator